MEEKLKELQELIGEEPWCKGVRLDGGCLIVYLKSSNDISKLPKMHDVNITYKIIGVK